VEEEKLMIDQRLGPGDLRTKGSDEMTRFRLDYVGLSASDDDEIS
jgi:hypothetical protein